MNEEHNSNMSLLHRASPRTQDIKLGKDDSGIELGSTLDKNQLAVEMKKAPTIIVSEGDKEEEEDKDSDGLKLPPIQDIAESNRSKASSVLLEEISKSEREDGSERDQVVVDVDAALKEERRKAVE